jgi:hypothetical protein
MLMKYLKVERFQKGSQVAGRQQARRKLQYDRTEKKQLSIENLPKLLTLPLDLQTHASDQRL